MPLGVLLLNENKGDEMIKIVNHMHQYVPIVEPTEDVLVPSISDVFEVVKTECHPVLLGGDQLTVARARRPQLAMADGCSVSKRVEGLIF